MSPPEGQFRMIFNVGARRSGTFWLQRIVTSHPDVAAVPSESHLFSDGIAPLFARFHQGDPGSVEVGSIYLSRPTLVAHARALCDDAFGPYAGDRRLLAERTPFHVRHLPLIAEIYPDASFVHIIRDGRDVASSLLAQPWGPGSIAEAAAEWRESVGAGQRDGAALDGYLEIRYEDLLADPETGIRDLFAALGLSAGERVLGAALAEAARAENLGHSDRGGVGAGKWRNEWGAAELAEFDREGGELLAALGYAERSGGSAQPAPRSPAGRSRGGRRMGRFWDARARENPYYFINNTLAYQATDTDRFWASGPEDLAALLATLGESIDPGDEVVELGCGIGRMTRPIAGRAARVWAIDVSPEMIRRAREENPQLDNVEWIEGDGTTLTGIADAAADACISQFVLQHIPDRAVIAGYVREMGRVLRPGGWAAFQVSNDERVHRPVRAGLRARLRAAIGRAPSGQEHPAWLGSALSVDELREVVAAAGLRIERLEGEGSQFCLVLARRPYM